MENRTLVIRNYILYCLFNFWHPPDKLKRPGNKYGEGVTVPNDCPLEMFPTFWKSKNISDCGPLIFFVFRATIVNIISIANGVNVPHCAV